MYISRQCKMKSQVSFKVHLVNTCVWYQVTSLQVHKNVIWMDVERIWRNGVSQGNKFPVQYLKLVGHAWKRWKCSGMLEWAFQEQSKLKNITTNRVEIYISKRKSKTLAQRGDLPRKIWNEVRLLKYGRWQYLQEQWSTEDSDIWCNRIGGVLAFKRKKSMTNS